MQYEEDPTIEQRPWGFFAFAVSALTVLLTTGEPPVEPAQADSKATFAPIIARAAAASANLNVRPKNLDGQSETAVPPTMESAEQKAVPRRTSDVISFATKSIVTTEKAVAAVFVLTRSQPMSGLARVRWEARSGTADAAIDFSDASGTAVMADGQRQVALYVPLRNDLLKESDETFKVCLHSPEHARLNRLRCVEATVRDDD